MVLDPKFSNRNDYGSIQSSEQTIPPLTVQRNSTHALLNPRTNLSTTKVPVDDDEVPATSKMTQGDLYQRQPLLPTPTKNEKWGHGNHPATKEYFDDEEDDGDDVIRNGSLHTNSNGVIKISMPAPVREEPKFPKEKWKTLIALFVMIINFILTTASLALVHERVPDRDKYGPLPDKFLDTVPALDWALDVSEYLIMISVNATALVLVFHKHRFIVLRRVFLILSLLYLMRAITMYITVLPVASKTYYCSPKANQTSAYMVTTRVLQLISGFGLSVNGKHTYCGDYIYSGHTVILVLSYLLISEYSPKRFFPLHWISWIVSFTGVIMVLLAHGHYSVDIVIAYYVTTRLFWTYHTLANNSQLKKSGPYNYIGREWWFPFFQYFEKNVGGPVPRQYDWPLPWPRRCHSKSRDMPDFSKNAPLVTGLEWEDPKHVNKLSISELRRLKLLITKIAAVVNLRRLVLRPYFQDYELVAKNVGTVTIAHFARVLAFLGITVSAGDFHLLVKRFLKDSYTLNYVAFVTAIDEAVNYMDSHGILDLGGDIMDIFPGRIINAELPKLPRPEIGNILLASVIGKQDNFHPAIKVPCGQEDLLTIVRRIQRHVLENRLRVNEFFKDFDMYNCGRITTNQFERGLDALGVGRIHRLYLSPEEIRALVIQYRDPIDPFRICWKTFENDIDTVFTYKCLEKQPSLAVDGPPQEVLELPKKGTKDWQQVNSAQKDLCEYALAKIRCKVRARRLMLKTAFRDYDTLNTGHVSRQQMRQCFVRYSILLTDEELYALEERFNDDVGFNYFWFLKEMQAKKFETPLFESYMADIARLNAPKERKPPTHKETDIVAILAKIKGKIVRERIRVIEFMRDYDRHNEHIITRVNFKRGLDVCRFDLSENEVDTLMNVFAAPLRNDFVEYKRFSDTVEEAFTQPSLERAPLLVPLQHVPTKDCDRNFLNFEERHAASMAIQKLSRQPEFIVNLMDVFKDYDPPNCGTVSRNQLMKVLAIRELHYMISSTEFDALCKCFGFERGLRDEVDYRALCKTLDFQHVAAKTKPF